MKNTKRWERGRTTDTRGFYDSSKWRRVAEYIRQKYFYTCQTKGCGEKGTYVHHIDPLTEKDYLERPAEKCYGEDNLTLLCFNCHEVAHKRMNTGIREGCYFDSEGNIQAKE